MFSLRFIISGIVLLLGLGGVTVYETQKQAQMQATATPAIATTTEEVSATATTIKKTLSVTPAGETASIEIPKSGKVARGDTLLTSHDGRGVVEMSNGSTAVLDYDSSVVIEGLDQAGTHTSLNLESGSVWARVKKVFGKGEFFEIKTRNAVAVVRGTSFGLTYHKDGSSTLLVGSGSVALTPLDDSGVPVANKAIVVPAGGKGMIDAVGKVTQSTLSSKERQSEWFLFNAEEKNTTPAPLKETDVVSPKTTTPTPKSQATSPTTNTTNTGSGSSPTGTVAAPSSGDPCKAYSEDQAPTGQTIATLSISKVTPGSVSLGQKTVVTIKGFGFSCVSEVQIAGMVFTEERELTISDDQTITFSSDTLPVGTFDVVAVNIQGSKATAPRALTVGRY